MWLRSEWLKTFLFGFIIASPIIAFPFSRLFSICFIILLISAYFCSRVLSDLKSQKNMIYALVAISGPIIVTCLVLPIYGTSLETLWVKKLAEALLGGFIGFSTTSLLRSHPRSTAIAQNIITTVVIFWMIDGLVQLLLGSDLFGVPLNNGRVGIFALKPYDFAYHFPLFAIFPIFSLYHIPKIYTLNISGRVASFIILILSTIISFAGGCRNSMLLIGIISIVWCFRFLADVSAKKRTLIISAYLGFTIVLSTSFYRLVPTFKQRIDQTLNITSGFSFEVIDKILSDRLAIWQPALEIINKNLIFGIGPNEFRTAVLKILRPGNPFYTVDSTVRIMHAHQVLVEIALGTGIFGLICFIAYYLYTTKYFIDCFKDPDKSKAFGFTGVLAFLLMWFPFGTHYNFYGSMHLFYSFYFLGLSFAACPRKAMKSN